MADSLGPNLVPKLSLPRPSSFKFLKIAMGLFGVSLLIVIGVFFWYRQNLKPVDTQSSVDVDFVVQKGSSLGQISQSLLDKKLIRNRQVFEIYNRLNKTSGRLKTGTFKLRSSMAVADIVNQLLTSRVKQIEVTFYPGATLNFRHNERDTTPSHRESLKRLGFDDREIDQAFAKHYIEHPLFKLLPQVKSLEGLIYGETLFFNKGSSVETVLRRYFDLFYQVIKENRLIEKYQDQGLTLYQGIILASLIQREAKTDADRAQVAQVFLKRFREGMKLGSDVTYQYICRLKGLPHNYNIDSPYNTRRYEGLPPTPIASPSRSALLALAKPATGDYVYFLAGDDGKTYFAYTYAEHENNIRRHCRVGCSVQ